jgi:hypothetical protein
MRRATLAALLMVAIAIASAHAADDDAAAGTSTPPLHSMFYKGVIGNALEVVPLEPDDRVQLQRGSSVVSNTLTGRSLGVLLGLVSPVMTVSGFVWGLWSAANIKSPSGGLPGAPVSDAVLIPVTLRSMSDASRDAMEDAIRALITIGGGE